MKSKHVGSAAVLGGPEMADELKILASTVSRTKLMEEIVSETGIPSEKCREEVFHLVKAGLLKIDHDSDLYGHELANPSKGF